MVEYLHNIEFFWLNQHQSVAAFRMRNGISKSSFRLALDDNVTFRDLCHRGKNGDCGTIVRKAVAVRLRRICSQFPEFQRRQALELHLSNFTCFGARG